MIKNVIITATLSLTALVILSSCGAKLRPLTADQAKAEPQPLELVGGKVPGTVHLTFPAKWFPKNAELTVIPVIRYQGGEKWGAETTFQGEKVQGNERVVPYREGSNSTVTFSIPYQPAMAKSELYLSFKGKQGKKIVPLPDLKVGDGVVATEALATIAGVTPMTAPDGFQRIIQEAYDANIMFQIQQANVRATELNKDEVQEWQHTVQNAKETTNQEVSVEVQAYASPDGGQELNEKLSASRERNTTSALKGRFKKEKLQDVAIDAHYTAQDWEGFKELVEKSDFQDKDLVLRVLSMYPDPEQREREIKNISSVFSKLAEEVLPKLRRSRLVANVKIIGRSDEEIQKTLKEYPSALSVEELLYAATLIDDPQQQESIYKITVQKYGNDYRAYNNLGSIYLQRGDYATAKSWFERALQKKDNAESKVNLGLLALNDGDVAKATSLIAQGSTLPGVGQVLGYLYLSQGDYAKAETTYGDYASNNAAVAQILNRNYSKALATLSAVAKPNALTEYLRAIIGARTNDASSAVVALQKAVALDPSLRTQIANDLEFAGLRGRADFAAIVSR
ncbi:tetratricopeptide repeat protein [uncultured Porphyromonas sp.]|uniref:tetratricopeptide repeat protein n=1 Tax=uncultured Porphyromonas sp. TaxID=159274 RepID=UPI0026297F6B|nr:tetratricopeptide repeat protein [uncultured Porphyromonas sp.]